MRDLKYHEQKLLKKVDFLNYKHDAHGREAMVTRRYHLTDRDDYSKYNKLCGLITKLVALIRQLDANDEIRVNLTDKLLKKLYNMGVIAQQKSLSDVDRLSTSRFVRRRLAVIMSKLKMAENVSQAAQLIEQGHVRVGPKTVTNPAAHISRQMEDMVTWVDTSKIKKTIQNYNDERDDYDLL